MGNRVGSCQGAADDLRHAEMRERIAKSNAGNHPSELQAEISRGAAAETAHRLRCVEIIGRRDSEQELKGIPHPQSDSPPQKPKDQEKV
jgi:hypothetical protein